MPAHGGLEFISFANGNLLRDNGGRLLLGGLESGSESKLLRRFPGEQCEFKSFRSLKSFLKPPVLVPLSTGRLPTLVPASTGLDSISSANGDFLSDGGRLMLGELQTRSEWKLLRRFPGERFELKSFRSLKSFPCMVSRMRDELLSTRRSLVGCLPLLALSSATPEQRTLLSTDQQMLLPLLPRRPSVPNELRTCGELLLWLGS